jgi:hypothetical protein
MSRNRSFFKVRISHVYVLYPFVTYLLTLSRSYGRKTWRKEQLENVGVDGDNIKVFLKERRWERVKWKYLVPNTDTNRALATTVMNIWVSKRAVTILTKQLPTSQEELWPM